MPDKQSLKDELTALLAETEEALAHAEGVAAMVPKLRSEARVLRKSIASLEGGEVPRRRGPTIRESIFAALAGVGGSVSFEPGGMLAAIHDMVGGNRSSVQVEIHRQEDAGRLRIDRDDENRPVAVHLATPPGKGLRAVSEDDVPQQC
jgi:hypothetical protein